MLQLYQNIRALRKLNHWTQEELATRMGYTDRSMIAKIESGKVDLARSKIIEFARIFNVPVGDLMGDDGVEITVPELDERARRIIEYYKRLTPEMQDSIENILINAQQKP